MAVNDALPEQSHQDMMIDVVKAPFDVSLYDPEVSVPIVDPSAQGLDAIHRASPWSEAIGHWQEVTLINGFQHHLEKHLHSAVFHRRDTQGSHLAIVFWDVSPLHRLWTIRLRLQLGL